MALRYMTADALAASDIVTTGSALTALSPDASHPVGNALIPAQSSYWKPPTTAFTIELSADTSDTFAIVWSGTFTAAAASWHDSTGTQLSTGGLSDYGTSVSETTASNAHSWRLAATGDVRIHRIMRGSMVTVDCALASTGTVPRAGLNPDFRDELVTSPANRFQGRFGRRSGEMAELQLMQIPRTDTASQGIRQSLMDGETVITLRLPQDTAPLAFYCWGDGIIPPADLSNALHWSMVLPIRYWVDVD